MNNKKQNQTNKNINSTLSTAESTIKSDVDGSYTGHPLDGGKPIQDADDL